MFRVIVDMELDTKINSYPKVYNLGHSAIRSLFEDEIVIQEKVDGSQFSFGLFNGEVKFRSKGVEVYPEKAGMFHEGVQSVLSVKDKLPEGVVFRGEYLQKPKHNSLTYDRIPQNHIVLFDLQDGIGRELYFDYEVTKQWADKLGFDCIPQFKKLKIDGFDDIASLMDQESYLGGCQIEGLVFKNYNKFTADGKAVMGKYVSENFKEIHTKDWKGRNPTNKNVIDIISVGLATEARWEKAVQHIKERGELEDSPKDIGNILKEVNLDIRAECEEEIKEMLYKWAIKDNAHAGFRSGIRIS